MIKLAEILRGVLTPYLIPSWPEKKQLFDSGNINLVPSLITTGHRNPQCLYQKLVTPVGALPHKPGRDSKAPGRKSYDQMHSKNCITGIEPRQNLLCLDIQ